MSEPTSALTTAELVRKIAVAASVAYYGSSGNEKAYVPIDQFKLQRCLDALNDGIRMFINSAPPEGWRWKRRIAEVTFTSVYETGTADDADSTSLTDATLEDTYDEDNDLNGYYIYVTGGTGEGSYALITDYTADGGVVTVADWLDANGNAGGTDPAADSTYSITSVETVGGDPTRYPLSQDFMGNVTGKITYAADSNRGHIIDWEGEGGIREEREVSTSTGYPTRAQVRPYGYRRWELVVNRIPSAADVVQFPYEKGFDELQLIGGDASGGSAVTLVDDDLANLYPDDYFIGWTVYVTSGTGKNARAVVTDYTGADGTFTVADWLAPNGIASLANPADGSAYYAEPNDNRHPAGPQFDEAIKSACLAQTEMEFEDIQAGYMDKFIKKDLPDAIGLDRRSAPRKLGPLKKRAYPRRETWSNVEYI